ncbi:hypothetical protein STEG23_025931, partial [Scotinomys teguina]
MELQAIVPEVLKIVTNDMTFTNSHDSKLLPKDCKVFFLLVLLLDYRRCFLSGCFALEFPFNMFCEYLLLFTDRPNGLFSTMMQSLKALIENADAVYEKIVHCQKAAMEFHEHLHSIGTKEGLKERKLQKAVESFTWNITILK